MKVTLSRHLNLATAIDDNLAYGLIETPRSDQLDTTGELLDLRTTLKFFLLNNRRISDYYVYGSRRFFKFMEELNETRY